MKKLFEYAVILHKFDSDKKYVDSELIVEPTKILAKTESDVAFKVTRLIPEEYAENTDKVEILIKVF